MWVIYCTLVHIWVRGLSEDGKKVLYTVNRKKAQQFFFPEDAQAVMKKLPLCWYVHCRVMRYAESTQLHDEYFDEQHKYYRIKDAYDSL